MEPDRAIEIIQSLADGVDPYSGDQFASDSPYQQAGTVRALHLAPEGLTKLRRPKARKTGSGRSWNEDDKARKTGSGRSWNEDEEKELLRQFDDKNDVEEIAAKHERTKGTIWARGEWRENSHNADGLLDATTYGDATPAVTLAYDAFQRIAAASNAVAAYSYANSAPGVATNETAAIGGKVCTLARGMDDRQRLVSLYVGADQVHYAYDAENRLAAVSNDVFAVSYQYTADGLDAGHTTALASGTTLARTVVRDPFRRQLVALVSNTVDAADISAYEYEYDYLGRVTGRNGDIFGYNARSEVTAASVATNEYGYAYDNIGNHLFTTINAITNTFEVNALNQYTSILCAPVPLREPTYDLDGNLLTNGVWSYVWDAENRMTAAYSNSVCVVSNAYDHASRRVAKWTPSHTTTFLYDGWNLVMEIRSSNITPFQSSTNRYVWGKDLSGTLQGAGGVGGLLAVSLNGSWFFPFYDANGNITAYVNDQGSVVASYAYDAFGATISQTGSLAHAFAHRFSTKYFDAETGLYYYGYRFYSPALMRWLNRDPIQEDGWVNLFVSCANNMLAKYDAVGLWDISRQSSLSWAEAKAEEGDTFQSLADLIKLDFLERTKWLKQNNNLFVAESAVAKKGCIYKIPNVMAVYTSKSGWGDGVIMYVTHLKKRAISDGNRYKAKGYKVIEKKWAASDDEFIDLWTVDGIVAISFAGHGSRYGFVASAKGIDINPSEVHPPYKLQAVRAYSCRSSSEIPGNKMLPDGTMPTHRWVTHISQKGSYIGFSGLVNWVSQFWLEESINPEEIPK